MCDKVVCDKVVHERLCVVRDKVVCDKVVFERDGLTCSMDVAKCHACHATVPQRCGRLRGPSAPSAEDGV